MNRIEPRLPGVGWRVALTVAVLLLCGVSVRVVSMLEGPVTGPLAVRQMADDPVDYSVGRAVAVADIPAVIEAVSAVLVLAVWVSYALRYGHYRHRLLDCQEPGGSA